MMLFASSAASWSQVTEDFENDYFPPKNWTVVYANPELQADGLMSLADNPDGSRGGKSFLFSSPAGFPDNPQQYLISPCLDVSSESVFGFQYWVPMDFSGKGAAYQVGWSVTGKAIEDFAWSETLYTGIADYYAGEEEHWAEYSKEDLPAGTRYICIAFVDETANKRLYVDNVALPALAPVSCDMPANLTYDASTNTLHWVVNGDSSTYLSFMLDFVLETSMEIKAVFVEEEEPQPEMYTLTITKVGEGETTPSTGEYTYEAGSNVELKAVAAENWHFVAWVVGQDSVRAADTAIVMTGDLAVTAVFVENLSNENPAACQFRIYPNPAWQNFVVASDEMILRLEVFDAAGRLVFRRENVNTDRLDVDVSAWPDGVYFVLVSDSKRQSAVRRMVVGR